MLQELDLAQGALGKDLLAEDIGDFLDGNTLVGLVVHGGASDGWSVMFAAARGDRESGNRSARAYQTIPYAPWPSSLVTV